MAPSSRQRPAAHSKCGNPNCRRTLLVAGQNVAYPADAPNERIHRVWDPAKAPLVLMCGACEHYTVHVSRET
jgi:hypothetical protein